MYAEGIGVELAQNSPRVHTAGDQASPIPPTSSNAVPFHSIMGQCDKASASPCCTQGYSRAVLLLDLLDHGTIQLVLLHTYITVYYSIQLLQYVCVLYERSAQCTCGPMHTPSVCRPGQALACPYSTYVHMYTHTHAHTLASGGAISWCWMRGASTP